MSYLRPADKTPCISQNYFKGNQDAIIEALIAIPQQLSASAPVFYPTGPSPQLSAFAPKFYPTGPSPQLSAFAPKFYPTGPSPQLPVFASLSPALPVDNISPPSVSTINLSPGILDELTSEKESSTLFLARFCARLVDRCKQDVVEPKLSYEMGIEPL